MTRKKPKSDNIPIAYMMAASESGMSVADYLDLSPTEADAWMAYTINGPSEARTQLLIAQLIQLVSSALGGHSIKLPKLLPWYAELTKPDEATRKKRHVARSTSVVMGLMEKKMRRMKDGK